MVGLQEASMQSSKPIFDKIPGTKMISNFLRTHPLQGRVNLTLYRRMIVAGACALLLPTILQKVFRMDIDLTRLAIVVLMSPAIAILDIWRIAFRQVSRMKLAWSNIDVSTSGINEKDFPQEAEFERVLDRLAKTGLRSTGCKAHEDFIDWVKAELADIRGLTVKEDVFSIHRWQTKDGASLQEAGSLMLGQRQIPIAGVVPFSRPTSISGESGPLIYLSRNTPFSDQVAGKVVLRPLPRKSIPNALGFVPSYSRTSDLNGDVFKLYERPSFWEHPMHHDLIAAGKHGAAGLIFLSDLPRDQLTSYWDPHQGTHYHVPALILGHYEAELLKRSTASATSTNATIAVLAEVGPAETRNVLATLPGQSPERIIYASHTDGNTLVQENGVAALLTLAKYFARQPFESRHRTIEFAFNTAHLQVSKEGSGRHAEQLDAAFDNSKDIALVIPVEHMGTRQLEAFSLPSGGRELRFTGRGETMFWCVGPSLPVLTAVQEAIQRRKLDRVLLTRGTSPPQPGRIPLFDSFGGLGTLYHNMLVPTTSLISGPWSLFAPSFGREAVDVRRLRNQTLAVGDVYLALESVSKTDIVGGYKEYRRRRTAGGHAPGFKYPPETL